MENLAALISCVSAIGGLLAAAVTFLVKFVSAVKQKNAEETARLLRIGAEEAVKFVEGVKSAVSGTLDGATKKTIALTKVNQFCINHGITYNESAAGNLIEEIVALSKTVNARVKDTRQAV